ncbi:MAG: hypothetical protein NW226_00755 [Microscillaceae bacterium]|nr:hypothetical protein [Microscillaceae bacterium]
MSELYHIQIKSIEDKKVSTEVKIIHPDAGNRFDSRDFALRILAETADTGQYWTKLPITREEWLAKIDHHPHRLQIQKWQSLLYGAEIPSIESEYKKLGQDRAYFEKRNHELTQEYGFGISSYGTRNGFYQIFLQPNYLAFVDLSYAIIPDKPSKRTILRKHYSFEFEVSEATYLYHLSPEMEYETAAFNLEDYLAYYR